MPKPDSIMSQVKEKIKDKLSDLNVSQWELELKNDIDKSFLLDGIRHGFSIVDREVVEQNVDVENHASSVNKTNKHKVEALLLSEINNGRYVTVCNKPNICSPLAAIEKTDGSLRLIHDASRPAHLALNDYSDVNVTVKYQSVRNAIELLAPGSFMCKIDLKSAYRSVGIKPSQYHMSGLKWQFTGDQEFTYIVDTRLMMGASKAPSIFHRLSQAIKRGMERRGYKLVAYLDDFLLVAENYETCRQGQNTLIALLRELGLSIAWSKVEGPCQKLVFLGIEIDSVNMTIGLPKTKVSKLLRVLQVFRIKKRASCKQLQRLAGQLNWASQVINCGRSYLRNILDMMVPLVLPYHKARLSECVHDDIQWWIMALTASPGKRVFYKPQVKVVQFDSSTKGSGFIHQGDWGYVDWQSDLPESKNLHINCKETISAVFAARRWAHLWRDSKVLFCTDNMTAKSCIIKGTSKNKMLLPWMRELHLYSVLYNFEIDACWIPGTTNIIPDAISRLRYPHLRKWFMSVLGVNSSLDDNVVYRLLWHMSNKSLISVFARNSDNGESIG